MAMMAKMRNLAPAFIIAVGGLFVLFMVVSDSRVLEIFGQPSQYVGVINGKEITYQEFNALVDRARENQKRQYGQDIDEEYMDQFRDQVWEALVMQTLIEQQYEQLGIVITDQEIRDIILGPNPPDFLVQNFIDSTGKFNREMYDAALFDPRNKEPLIAAEEAVKQQRMQEKLESYINASVIISEWDIKRKFTEQNIRMNVEYAFIDANSFSEKDLTVTDDELKNYYNTNKDLYKNKAQRKVSYVVFSKEAAKEDTLSIKNELEAILEKAKTDTSFQSYVEYYSELPYSKDTLKINQLPQEVLDVLMKAKSDDITDPILSYEGYGVYRLISKISSKEQFVRASHILIPDNGDLEKAKKEADEIYEQLKKGADFSKLAKEKSTDPGSAAKGGDLGWFGKGQMVKEFEEASFNGKIGEIQKPVKTQYGYHIIKTTGKSNESFVVEKIIKRVKASMATIDRAYNSASDFAYVAKKEGFENIAKTFNYKVSETPLFAADALYIPGIGVNQYLLKFAFDDKPGDVSDVFKVPTGFAVAKIIEEVKEGFKSLDEVKEQVKAAVIKEKRFAKAKDIADKIYKSRELKSVKNIFQNGVYDSTGIFTAVSTLPKIGKDNAFIENSLSLEINKLSEPFRGLRGYYVIKVKHRNEFDQNAYSAQRQFLKNSLMQQKKSTLYSQWTQQLKMNAKIEDNRYRFFR